MNIEQPSKTAMTIEEQLEAHTGAMRPSHLAMIFAVSYDAVYDWITKCGCPASKVNGSYWLDGRLVARWWRAHSTAIANPTKPPVTGRKHSIKAAKVAQGDRFLAPE
jgi:hypothetical protein